MIRKRSFVLLLNLLISFYLLNCAQDDNSDTSENPQYNSDHSKQKIKVNQMVWSEETLAQLNSLEKSILKKIDTLFQDINFSSYTHKLEDVEQIIGEVEPQVRQITKTDTQQWNNTKKEFLLQNSILTIEKRLYSKIKQMMDDYLFTSSQRHFNQQINSLTERVKESKTAMRSVNMEPVFHESDPYNRFQRDILGVAQQKIKSKYTRAELGLLKEEDLVSPKEDPYRFLSPEGEFLDKLQDVYDRLRNANPYHEQGVLARECGLQNVILGDQEFLQGNKEKAQEEYNSAQFLMKIVLGELPLGKEREIYQTCTGKDLFTGALVKN